MMTQERATTPEIIPSLSGRELLDRPEVVQIIYELKSLVSCPDRIYKRLYRVTLRNLAEYCQAMPYTENDFSEEYGFFIRQLKLAVSALKLRRGILFPKNSGAESIAAEEAQWTYAIFSGCLANNLFQLQENREVRRYQLQGDLVGTWLPMTESLYKKSFYYSMDFSKNDPVAKLDIFMAAISQHIFPNLAIHWLSTNKDLFKLWWDVLLHQPSADNDIEAIIQLAGNKARIKL